MCTSRLARSRRQFVIGVKSICATVSFAVQVRLDQKDHAQLVQFTLLALPTRLALPITSVPAL